MCNPNTSIANRRYRSSSSAIRKSLGVASAVFNPASLLTQKLMGDSMPTGATTSAIPPPPPVKSTFFSTSGTVTETVDISAPHLLPCNPFSYQAEKKQQLHQELGEMMQYASQPMQDAKPKPRRRRKPQKPGLTAKNQVRHFVHHNYVDHANDFEHDGDESDAEHSRRRGGVAVSFPLKLHGVLEQIEEDGFGHICSWQPHGRCFLIHKPQEFTDTVMPLYFRQTKLTSFQRQLNLYGFQRLTRGPDQGSYYNELFLRGKGFLCKRMQRTKVKGTKFKAASSPEEEPDFYKMPPLPPISTQPGVLAAVPAQVSDSSDHSDDGSSNGDGTSSNGRNGSERSYFEPSQYQFETGSYREPSFERQQAYYNPAPSYTGQPSYLAASISTTLQGPLSPMVTSVNSLAAATFGGSPLRSAPQLAMPHLASMSASVSASPVAAAAAAIFPSTADCDDGLLDDVVDDLFFDAHNQDSTPSDQQSIDKEMMHFVNSFDPQFSSFLDDKNGEDISDLELGNLLDKMLDGN